VDLWRIDQQTTWPPRGRPTPPLTPSLWRLLRLCGLQAVFNASPDYPRRSLPAQRVGTAVHRTLRYLVAADTNGVSPEDFARSGLEEFRRYLDDELVDAKGSARERDLPWSTDRVQRAESAIIIAARRTWRARATAHSGGSQPLLEQGLRSHNGLLAGIPDRVDRFQRGLRIVEYKTHASPSSEDIAEHTDQLMFYAYLAFETYGEWPAEGLLSYVVAGHDVHVPIDPQRCLALANEAAVLAQSLIDVPDRVLTANPGLPCAGCEFRPWCRPFWNYQAERLATNPLDPALEWGIEGVVLAARSGSDVALLELEFGGQRLVVRMPLGRYPQLRDIQLGARLRFLDVEMHGPAGLRTVTPRDYTEAYQIA